GAHRGIRRSHRRADRRRDTELDVEGSAFEADVARGALRARITAPVAGRRRAEARAGSCGSVARSFSVAQAAGRALPAPEACGAVVAGWSAVEAKLRVLTLARAVEGRAL